MPRRSSLPNLLLSASKLPIEDLEYLTQQLQALLNQRQAEQEKSEESDGQWREEYRKCGKATCWCAKAEEGKGHGPYLYRTVRKGDRVIKEYKPKR